jgi:heat shock protein 4
MTIGFDLGGKNCVTAVTRKNVKSITYGNFIDIVLDESSKRMITSTIGFSDKERSFGNTAEKKAIKNIQGTIINPLEYNGKIYSEISSVRKHCNCPIVPNPRLTEGNKQTSAFKIFNQGNVELITPEHAISLLLKYSLSNVQKLKIKSKECCISIPNNSSYSYRETILRASELAGVECLKLSTSTECLAASHGILNNYITKECSILYLDLGHQAMNVGCVRFFKGGWEIINSDSYTDFCGDAIDKNLIDYFSKQFEFKHGEVLTTDPRSIRKIMYALPKLKMNLTINREASTTIDFIYKDFDFTLSITREELYKQNEKLINSFTIWLRKFIQESKKKLNNKVISSVEAVGGVSRMFDLKKILCKVLEEEIQIKQLNTTLNCNEEVAKGAVLQSAMLSPCYHLSQINIKEIIPWNILVSRENLDFDVTDWKNCKYEMLFPRFSELNKTKTITFKIPRSMCLMIVQKNQDEIRDIIGFAKIDPSNIKLLEEEYWHRFQIIVTLTKNGLLDLQAESTKYCFETINEKKEEEVPLNEEELKAAIHKAVEQAQKKSKENFEKKKKEIEESTRSEDKKNEEIKNIKSESIDIKQIENNIKKTKLVEKIEKKKKKNDIQK